MARIAGGASSAAADASSRPSAFRRDCAVVDGHAAALVAGFAAADASAVRAAGGRNGAVIDDHGVAVFFIAAADASSIVAAVGGQAAVVDGDRSPVDFITAADTGAVRAAGGGQAAAQHGKAATGVRARLVTGTDARSIVAAVCRDRAAVDGKASTAGVIAAADARVILRAGADQFARILLLTVDAQTVARGKLDALAAGQRRPVAEDQVHVAADGQTVGKAAALGENPHAAGQVFVVLQGGDQRKLNRILDIFLHPRAGPAPRNVRVGRLDAHADGTIGHPEGDPVRRGRIQRKVHIHRLAILVVSYDVPGPALEGLTSLVEQIRRHGDGLSDKGLPLIRIQAEARIMIRHDPPGALQLRMEDHVRVRHDEIPVKVEILVISHVFQVAPLSRAVLLPGDPGAPDAVAAHVFLVVHMELRRDGIARHGALLIGRNGKVGLALEETATQRLPRHVDRRGADPVSDLHEVRRNVDVMLGHGKGIGVGRLTAGAVGGDAAAAERQLHGPLPPLLIQPEDLQTLRAVGCGIAHHDADGHLVVQAGAGLVRRDGVACTLRVGDAVHRDGVFSQRKLRAHIDRLVGLLDVAGDVLRHHKGVERIALLCQRDGIAAGVGIALVGVEEGIGGGIKDGAGLAVHQDGDRLSHLGVRFVYRDGAAQTAGVHAVAVDGIAAVDILELGPDLEGIAVVVGSADKKLAPIAVIVHVIIVLLVLYADNAPAPELVARLRVGIQRDRQAGGDLLAERARIRVNVLIVGHSAAHHIVGNAEVRAEPAGRRLVAVDLVPGAHVGLLFRSLYGYLRFFCWFPVYCPGKCRTAQA